MPSIASLNDEIISDIGFFFAAPVINRAVIEAAKDYCIFSGSMNKPVYAEIKDSDIDKYNNMAVSVSISPFPETRPCSAYGITINGVKVVAVERDIGSPSGADGVIATRSNGIYYHFDDSTVCKVHPVTYACTLLMTIAFVPEKTATQIDDGFWEKHGPAILCGAKAKLLSLPGYKSFNPQMTAALQNEYIFFKRKARSDVNRTLIGESLI